jgi:hypothetical protein
VIQEFQQAAAALALPTLPACIVGPAYQIADAVNCGHYTGANATFSYAGLAPGGVVDLSPEPADVAAQNVWKGVSLTLQNAYLVTVSGANGAALTTGDIDIGANGPSAFKDPTVNAFVGFDPAAAGAPSFYVEVTGGTGLNAADQGRKFIVAKVDSNTLRVATEFQTTAHVSDVNYRILQFRLQELFASEDLPARGVRATADGVNVPAGLTTKSDLTPLRVVECDVLLSWRALRPDLAGMLSTFTDNDSLKAVFGVSAITPANPAAFALNLALQNTTTPVSFAGLDATYFSDEETAWQSALQYLESQDVYGLAILTHNAVVHQDASVHVTAMSEPQAGHERICFISRQLSTTAVVVPPSGLGYNDGGTLSGSGYRQLRDPNGGFISSHVRVGEFVELNAAAAAGGGVLTAGQQSALVTTRHQIASVDSEQQLTLVDDPTGGAAAGLTINVSYRVTRDLTKDEQAEFIAGYSSSFANRRVVHTWPDILAVSANAVATPVPGYFAGAVLVAMTAGLPSQAGFTNLSVAGFVGRANSDDRFSDAQLDVIAGGGTLVFTQPVQGAALSVRHQLTTDVSTIYFQELSVTKNVDLVARFLRQLFAPFVGSYNITETLLDLMKTRGEGGIAFLKEQTAPRVGAPLKTGSLSRIEESATQPDAVELDFRIGVPLPLNSVKVTLFV